MELDLNRLETMLGDEWTKPRQLSRILLGFVFVLPNKHTWQPATYAASRQKEGASFVVGVNERGWKQYRACDIAADAIGRGWDIVRVRYVNSPEEKPFELHTLESALERIKTKKLAAELAKSEAEKLLLETERRLSVLLAESSDELLSYRTLLCRRVAKEPTVGIYFLFSGDAVVYIGQSINIYGRLAAHLTSKKFDSYAMVECKPEDLNRLEHGYICRFRPAMNLDKNGFFTTPLAKVRADVGADRERIPNAP